MKQTQKRALFTVFLIVATELIGFGLIIPILPQIAIKFESSKIMIGLLMASYSIAQFIAAPILGSLSDRYGRKPILILSKMGTVFSYILLALSHNYWLFLISRVIDGCTGGNISVARAYITDILPKEERSKGMAIIGIAFGTGFIFGPALGGLLYGTTYGHVPAAIVAGSLSFIALILTIFLLEEPEKHHKMTSPSEHLKVGLKILTSLPIQVIAGCYFLYMLVFSGFETTFALYNHLLLGLTEKQNSWMYVFAGILGLLIQGGISRKKVAYPKNASILGFILAGIGFMILSRATTTSLVLVGLTVFSFGICFVNTFLPALLTFHTDDEHRGIVMGVYEGIGSLSRAIGPLLAFSLIMTEPQRGYLMYGSALVLIGSILYTALKQRNNPHASKS